MPITTDALTWGEQEVLRVVGRGLTDAEIAGRLAVTETAVASRLRGIRTRLGIRDRSAAIVYAFDHGLLTATPAPRAWLEISVLGPLRAWRAGGSRWTWGRSGSRRCWPRSCCARTRPSRTGPARRRKVRLPVPRRQRAGRSDPGRRARRRGGGSRAAR